MTGSRGATERIARQVRPDAAITGVEELTRGSRKATAVLRFVDADPIVVQCTADPDAAAVETHLLEAVDARTSVPVVPALDSGSLDGTGWLVTPLVDGTDLHESFTRLGSATRKGVARSFGRCLAELHDAFRFEACGPVTVADGRLAVDASPGPVTVAGGLDVSGGGSDDPDGGCRQWLTALGRASVARLPSAFDAVRSEVRTAIDAAEIESRATPRLFPWDFRPGNALVDDGRVVAVLDWEAPLAAAPVLSVAKAEYLVADWYVPGEAEALRAAFRAGYESVRARPSVRRAHWLVAVASAAVDSRGGVTNPGYPPVSRSEAVAFHLRSLEALV